MSCKIKDLKQKIQNTQKKLSQIIAICSFFFSFFLGNFSISQQLKISLVFPFIFSLRSSLSLSTNLYHSLSHLWHAHPPIYIAHLHKLIKITCHRPSTEARNEFKGFNLTNGDTHFSAPLLCTFLHAYTYILLYTYRFGDFRTIALMVVMMMMVV